uniref:PBCV-1 P7 disulphide-bonded domain-containing protein n=1 Tax=Chromera velia CCMP2878 TaxID=1169474 RepID=A0A0G4HR04_9ALVE|eukprot:Cvel_30385.t1-p1 / transcript=Cvel_30385.t1 / gene=Cvel_30385 / organism=Chromera_velia_CCMP2878 / gene_product=Glycoprotein gp2, putative / transcript_product=Glycoprotein gp2, putative / location=Cvel_scaffold4322:7958-9988(-) / protein_length=677 / sequence_SO=supercontig / SO=protein_coding / is_pseudo=false
MEGGACIVTGSSTEYSTQSIQTSVNVPTSTPVSSSACPSGTTMGADGSCTARLSFQSVEQSSSQKSVRLPTLSSKPATFNLPMTTLRTGSTCPQGTSAQADGTCTVTLRTSSLESYEVPVSSQVPVISQVPQTLTLTKQFLVPSYSCPAGTIASGSGSSMSCTVTLPSASPVTSSAPRTVKQARFEKRPVTVTVSRVESTPVYYCPTGTVENAMGECTTSITIRTPYTVSETHTACPADATEYPGAAPGSADSFSGKGAAPSCKRATTVTVPATLLPGSRTQKSGSYACPEGTSPIGEGASMTCAAPSYETVPMESYTTSSIQYETSTVTETVPKLYRYETRTVTETATTEEVYTVYDDIVLEETSVSLSTSSYTETVPALVSYSVASESETVTVSNDRISYVSCSDAMSGNYGPGASLAPGVSGSCLTETKFRVVTNSYTEAVPAVATYFTEETSETTTVEETFQTYDTSSMTETSHSVSTDYTIESVGPNTLVDYETSYAPETVTETKIVSTPVPMTETVSMIPTYTTETVMETAHSETVGTANLPSTMMTSELSYRTETISETVVPTTTYRTESSTTYSCPAGTVDTGSACASTVSVPAEFSCPAGSSSSGSAAGGCTKTTYTQVTSCPEGFTDTGKKCVTTASIPATPMAAPAPKGKYSAPTKHSRRHGHKHD